MEEIRIRGAWDSTLAEKFKPKNRYRRSLSISRTTGDFKESLRRPFSSRASRACTVWSGPCAVTPRRISSASSPPLRYHSTLCRRAWRESSVASAVWVGFSLILEARASSSRDFFHMGLIVNNDRNATFRH